MIIKYTPVVSSAVAYTYGDCIGSLFTLGGSQFTTNSRWALNSVSWKNTPMYNTGADIIFFDSYPDGSDFRNNVKATIPNHQLGKIIASCSVMGQAASYTAYPTASGMNMQFIDAKNQPLESTDGNIYAAILARNVPTYNSTSAVELAFKFLQAD